MAVLGKGKHTVHAAFSMQRPGYGASMALDLGIAGSLARQTQQAHGGGR